MLVGADQRGCAVGERQPQPIGADVAFGVREARREVHVVQGLQQAVITAHPAEHHAVGVGQHQADRFIGQRAMQVEEHFVAALGEQRFQVVGAGEDGFDAVRRHAVSLAALPGRQESPGHLGCLAVLQLMQLHSIR